MDPRAGNGASAVIEHKVHARVGLLGNPSDVYYGRTISLSLGNFSAFVRLQPSEHLLISPHPTHDLVQFDSLGHLVHSTVRQRWLDGDKFIISSMEEVANLPLEGRTALQERNYTKFSDLMNRNFDLRRSMFGDDAVGALNIKMVEVARRVGAAAKFTGSGGAVVAFCPNGPSQVKLLKDACDKAGFVIELVKVVPSCLNEIDLKTLSSQ